MFSGIFQPLHLLIILAIVMIIFGAGKLSKIGGGLAQSIKAFKKEWGGKGQEISHVHPASGHKIVPKVLPWQANNRSGFA